MSLEHPEVPGKNQNQGTQEWVTDFPVAKAENNKINKAVLDYNPKTKISIRPHGYK